MRQGKADRRRQCGCERRRVRGKVVSRHACAHARRDVLSHGLDALGRGLDAQRQIQRGFQVGRDRLRVAVPARRRHAFAHAFQDVRADFAGIQLLQERQDHLQVVQILLLHRLTLLNGRDDLRHIGGQLRYALGREVDLHAGIQRALVGGRAEHAGPEFIPGVVIQRLLIRLQAGERGLDQV